MKRKHSITMSEKNGSIAKLKKVKKAKVHGLTSEISATKDVSREASGATLSASPR